METVKADIYKDSVLGLIPRDWDVKLLPEVFDYIHGKAHEQYINKNGKFIVVNSKFISTEGSVIKKSEENFCPAKTGDILTVLSDLPNGKALAKTFYVDKDNKYAVNQRICIWRSKKDDSRFLSYIMNRNKYFLKYDDGVTQTHILNHHIEKCPVLVPRNKLEQKAIAQVLSDTDALIQALEKKIAKKKLIKKGVMQRLLTPKDGWEKVEMKEVMDFANGKPLEPMVTKNGAYNLITLDSISIEGKLKHYHKRVSINDNSLRKYDVVTVLSDIAHAKLLGLTDLIPSNHLYVLNQRMGRLRFSDEVLPKFASQFINYNQEYFRKRGQGSSQRHIYKKDFDEFILSYPTHSEQVQIAETLFDMDKEIENLKIKLSKYQLAKQGMMQQLLTGKIRLV